MSAFDIIASMLRAQSGLCLTPDKDYLVTTRLEPILRRRGLRDLHALAARINNDPILVTEVVDAMTTNETLFFRDGRPFDHLHAVLLPTLHRSHPPGMPIRIWSAAASTGQEAYSIAMLVREMGPALTGRPVEIIGTDISPTAIDRARKAVYSSFEVRRGLSAPMLAKYFQKEGDGWRVVQAVRDMVGFQQTNLLSDLTSFGRFDIVFCRNVLIYFDPATKRKVLKAIAAQMTQGAMLFLGGAETALGVTEDLLPCPGHHGVYVKQRQETRALTR
ncbi:CheR family methyltransferase [Rhizosaccharibacter radicis]|uniref:protein-glutamate O-methyltransferase n=1 Tax=Rhizosaccharibacter radicis TaxID=2782605 RepID=A0ABT1VY90_9PROT|nr:protein-glutamate O-methyltransferase CheR [Acetobacteraceae bacterium KSS12]